MAERLVRAGAQIIVWNRSQPATDRLVSLGASAAATPQDLLRKCSTIFIMLANEAAIDEVLSRGTSDFPAHVAGRLLVNLGTVSPAWSVSFAQAIADAGGSFVEAPVSGSRRPAEEGQLVGLVAGPTQANETVRRLIAPLCRVALDCGEVPGALHMKLAVNLYLVTMVAGLAESYAFAKSVGISAATFREAVKSGPMASAVAIGKLDKLVRSDFSPEASIADVHMNARLIDEAASNAGIRAPLIRAARNIFAEAEDAGLGLADMIACSAMFGTNGDDGNQAVHELSDPQRFRD